MNSIDAWAHAAGGERLGLRWRDAATARMIEAGGYVPYEELVAQAAEEVGLGYSAVQRLEDAWRRMQPWPDAASLSVLPVTYGFVTNTSARLAQIAAARSGLRPTLVLPAEEASWYKPRPEIYRLACGRMGSPGDRTLFVAGAAYDAVGARDAGLMAAIVVRRPLPPDLDDRILRLAGLGEVPALLAKDGDLRRSQC
jgi:2-haloacid dehalogenase